MPTVSLKTETKSRLDLIQAEEVVKTRGRKKRSLDEIIAEALDLRDKLIQQQTKASK